MGGVGRGEGAGGEERRTRRGGGGFPNRRFGDIFPARARGVPGSRRRFRGAVPECTFLLRSLRVAYGGSGPSTHRESSGTGRGGAGAASSAFARTTTARVRPARQFSPTPGNVRCICAIPAPMAKVDVSDVIARPRRDFARGGATLRGTRRAGEARSACLARGLARGALAAFRGVKSAPKDPRLGPGGCASFAANVAPRMAVPKRGRHRAWRRAVESRTPLRAIREGGAGARGRGRVGRERRGGAARVRKCARARVVGDDEKSRKATVKRATKSKCPRCFWLRSQKHETARRTNKTTRASGHASVAPRERPKITRPRVILHRWRSRVSRIPEPSRLRVRGEGRSVDRRLWIF